MVYGLPGHFPLAANDKYCTLNRSLSNIISKEVSWIQSVVLGIILTFFVYLAVAGIIHAALLYRDSAFILGRIYYSDIPGKGRQAHYYEYYFRGNKYRSSIVDITLYKNDSNYILLSIDRNQPNRVVVEEFIIPPLCLSFEDVPFDGWMEIPTCR